MTAPSDPRNAPLPWPKPALVSASLGLHAGALASMALWPQHWPWAAGAVAANHALITATGLLPRSSWLGPNVRRLPAEHGRAVAGQAAAAVCITIDDGPDPEVTPAVLDLLDQHSAKASFFCIAQRAQAHPALLREIVKRGHCVQNHSLTHSHRFSLMGPKAMRQEVEQGQQILAGITGHWPHCFRAPAGLRNPFLDPVLHRLGLHLVSWTRRGFDTRQGHAPRVLQRLSQGLAAGDILLMHDGHAARTAAGRPVLLEVLPPLLAHIHRLNLQCLTLTQALAPRQARA